MRKLLLIFLLTGMMCANNMFAQNKDSKTNLVTLKYCIDSLGFPTVDYKNETPYSKRYFERDLKNWYEEYPGYELVLKIRDYDQYKKILKIIAIENYHPKPMFIDTGNPKQDEINYKKAMKQWSENHPDYPQYIDTGNPKQDKENLRKARLAFYNKYIKED